MSSSKRPQVRRQRAESLNPDRGIGAHRRVTGKVSRSAITASVGGYSRRYDRESRNSSYRWGASRRAVLRCGGVLMGGAGAVSKRIWLPPTGKLAGDTAPALRRQPDGVHTPLPEVDKSRAGQDRPFRPYAVHCLRRDIHFDRAIHQFSAFIAAGVVRAEVQRPPSEQPVLGD